MDDIVTGARAELTVTVDLPRERLWELVTDVTRVGAWSPECVRAAWLDEAAPGPRVGARFEGHNHFADGVVTTVTCVVTEVIRPSTFAWIVLDRVGDPTRPSSAWRYDLLPTDAPGQTLVRHAVVHGPGGSGVRRDAERDPSSLDNRLAQLRQNMSDTLAAMARHAISA